MLEQKVILVDENDNEVGTMEKLMAHRKPNLHRAFSVFIFNENGEMLLQQRAFDKYHSGGLWTNACCSHPMPGEDVLMAAKRRLKEELGFDTGLKKLFDFIYQASFENGLTEFEYDHVFVGNFNGAITPAKNEVADHCFRPIDFLKLDIVAYPDKYTEWFKIALPRLGTYLGL